MPCLQAFFGATRKTGFYYTPLMGVAKDVFMFQFSLLIKNKK